MVVEMVQNSTFQNFIHIQNLFIHIQHLYLFNIQYLYLYSSVIFLDKIIPHLEIPFRFKNLLLIKDLLGMSLTHGSDALSAAN